MLKFHPVYENWMGLNLNLNICIKFLVPKLMKEKKNETSIFFEGRWAGNPRVDELLTTYKNNLQEDCQNPRGI